MSKLVAALLVLLAGLLSSQAQAAPATRPNIVLIFADDLGWADLPAYGNTVTEAPAIDRLAREGVRFTRFYGQPVCSPSRVELMSGQYPVRYGITDFIPGHWRPFERVNTPRTAIEFQPQLPPMGEALRALGYHTAYFGKWHLGENLATPASLGFDEAEIGYGFNHMADPTTPSADAIAARAEGVIANAARQPFLLVLSPSQPHIPLRAHSADIDHFAQRLEASGNDLPVAEYAAMVLDFDRIVGRVVDALDAAGVADNTLLVVMSDNGGLEHTDLGLDTPVTSNAPLRGEKGMVYEGGLRIPLIVRWPGRAGAGRDIGEPTSIMDLLPTFIEAAGGTNAGRDGVSLVPLLAGATDAAQRDLFYHYPHYHHGRPGSAIIAGNWKLVQHLDDNSVELYDLDADIGEATDVSAAQPDRAANLLARLTAWRDATGARMTTPNPHYDPARAGEWWRLEDGTRVETDFLHRLLDPRPFDE